MLTAPLFIVLLGALPPAHLPAAGPVGSDSAAPVPTAPVPAVKAPALTLAPPPIGPAAQENRAQVQAQVWAAHVGHVRAAPVVAAGLVDGQILVEDGDHGVSSLDPVTGELRWFVQMPGRLDGFPAPGDGALVLCSGTDIVVVNSGTGHRLRHISTADIAADSPVSDGQMVYVPSLLGDRLIAIDLTSGRTDWEFRMGSPFTAPALLLGDVARRSVLVACDDGTLRSVPAGLAVPDTERWVTRVGRLAGAPISDGKRLYLNTADRSVLALDPGAGTTIWRHLPGEPLVGKPVLGGGMLFAGTKASLLALDAATGVQRWKRGEADRPLDATATALLVARGEGTALLSPADGRDLLASLPRDVFVAGDLLVELQHDGTLVASHLPH